MASEIAITIKNLPEIKKAFGMAPDIMGRELNTAIKKSVFTIQADSMRGTPVDTGRLRASTYSVFGHLKGEVGTNTSYDVFVHNGTRFMRGRPYLQNAVTKDATIVDQFFTEAVDKTLNQIGRMT